MAYQPIHEGSFDVTDAEDFDIVNVLDSIFERKMVLVGWKRPTEFGDGEFPEITIRGTRAQFVSWLREFYDPDGSGIGAPAGCDDAALWNAYCEADFIKFVA